MNSSPRTLIIVLIVGILGNNAWPCESSPPPPTITVSGAQPGNQPKHYFVEIPQQGTTTITITGSGQTPCPTNAEKCKCGDQVQDLIEDGSPKYTFSFTIGQQTPADGSTITWDVSASTAPGEYKFKVTNIEQKYQPCPSGWTGGVTSKNNSQPSDEIVIYAVKVELDDIIITGGGSQNVFINSENQAVAEAQTTSVDGFAKFSPTSAESTLNGHLKVRMVQNANGVGKEYLINTPPTGYQVTTGGNFVPDGISNVGTVIISGGITTSYTDTPTIYGDKDTFKQLTHNLTLKIYLQYTLDGSNWKTIGTREWTHTANAIRDMSTGQWSGSAFSSAGGAAVASTASPILSGTSYNALPPVAF